MENKQTENKVVAVQHFWKLKKPMFGPNWSGGMVGYVGGGVYVHYFFYS